MDKNFQEGEIVWAKIKGYPWWPGIVIELLIKIGQIFSYSSSVFEDKILVNFIGDCTHAYIQYSKLAKYRDKYKEYSRTKKRSLLHSIDLANRAIKGDVCIKDLIMEQSKKNEEDPHTQKDNTVAYNTIERPRTFRPTIIHLKRKREREDKLEVELTTAKKEFSQVDEIKQSIEDLILCQATLLNHKTILNQVENLLHLIRDADINVIPLEMISILISTLKMYTNKSTPISIKASELIDMVKEKFLFDLFDALTLNLYGDLNDICSYDKFEIISLINQEVEHSNENETKSQLDRENTSKFQTPNKKPTRTHRKISDEIRLEDECSMYDISIHSTNTDCEEVKPKMKIKLFPLDKKEIYSILVDYFSDFDIVNEDDFCDKLNNGVLLQDDLPSQTVKQHYLRKRVCYRLYTVFEPLLKQININEDLIKHLSKYLEYKARVFDPDMGKDYRNNVTNIFNKIKNKFTFVNLETTTSE